MFKPFFCSVVRSLSANSVAPLFSKLIEKIFFVVLSAEPELIISLVVEDNGMVIPDVAIAFIDSRTGYFPISRRNTFSTDTIIPLPFITTL